MIKYLGSKRRLLPMILAAVRATREGGTVLDPFSGTARVGHALKEIGYRVVANDCNAYAATLARCYVQADAEEVQAVAEQLIRELNGLPGQAGYFTETYCIQSRFFQPKNGERIDAIREAIAAKGLPPELEAVLLVALMEAADRVDSTTGVQMAYLKDWAPRAFNDLELRLPKLLARARHGKGIATQVDAAEFAREHAGEIAYIDPPYNQHSYLGNYHIWESLVTWDKPTVYGVACKRVDCRERKSPFNQRANFRTALHELLQSLTADAVIVSFNDEGFISRLELEQMLATLFAGGAHVQVLATDYPRYVGAQIGIYNPRGDKVGRISHLRNQEMIFVATRQPLQRLNDLTVSESVG
jgi:adenine-specific DNA-methyltransferase